MPTDPILLSPAAKAHLERQYIERQRAEQAAYAEAHQGRRLHRIPAQAFAPGTIDRDEPHLPNCWRTIWRLARNLYQVVAFVGFMLLIALATQATGIWQVAEAKQAALCARMDAAQ